MKRGSWLWFFLILLILASVAITIPIVYNLRLQLKPEQLEQARERWQRRGTPKLQPGVHGTLRPGTGTG